MIMIWIDSLRFCGTDPLDKSSVPNDLDNDGVCDSLDKDTDNDYGVILMNCYVKHSNR